jgi:hypothetical protein
MKLLQGRTMALLLALTLKTAPLLAESIPWLMLVAGSMLPE